MRFHAQRAAGSDLQVTLCEGDYQTCGVGTFDSPTQTSFEEKLDPLPAATEFSLMHVTSSKQDDQDRMEATLPALLAKHGMKLVDQVSPPPSAELPQHDPGI